MTSHSNLDKMARAIMRDNPGMTFLSARRTARRQRATATPTATHDVLPKEVAHPGFGTRPDSDPCRIPIGQSIDGEVFLDLSRHPGVLCGGMPGTGKTNLAMAILGHLAGHAEMIVFDGKGVGAVGALAPSRVHHQAPDSPDTLHAVLAILTERMMASGARTQALAQTFGQHRSFWDIPAAEREAEGFFPIIVVIDEFIPWFTPNFWTAQQDREACQEIIDMIRSLIMYGHAGGIIVCLFTQGPDSVTVPMIIREAIGIRIALGALVPQQAESVLGTALTSGLPSPVDFYTRRQCGRGVIASAGSSPLVVQTYGVDIHQLKEVQRTHPPVTDQALASINTTWNDLLGAPPR